MSRSLAAVVCIALGLPILAMVALAANGGFNPQLLMTFLIGGVLMAFVVGAIFEIQRLVELEDHPHPEPRADVSAEALARPKTYDAPSTAAATVQSEAGEATGSRASPDVVASAEPLVASAPEPIVIEPAEPAAPPPNAKTKQKARKVKVSESHPAVPATASAPPIEKKRKTSQRKPATTV
jgi:hypothetical protein